jgi:hypothetical protein
MNDKVRIFENKTLGGFEVEYDGIAVAQFFYCTEWDERDFMTRDAAKKLATKIARYIVSRGTTSMNNKRRFRKGDLVRFINTGRHPEIWESLAEGSLAYVQGGEDRDHCILIKTEDNEGKRYPFYEFELVEETEHEVFVRYTRDEAIILFNYQPVLRIPTRYKLGDQEVDMCEEVVDWANQIVEDLNEHVILPAINKTKNEKEKK